jgi:hypothetical protein
MGKTLSNAYRHVSDNPILVPEYGRAYRLFQRIGKCLGPALPTDVEVFGLRCTTFQSLVSFYIRLSKGNVPGAPALNYAGQ